MYEVCRIELSRRFSARLCSTAVLLHVFLLLLVVFLTLLLAFRTHESRFDTVVVHEQPTVLYEQCFLVVLHSINDRYWLWSSSVVTNQMERDHLKPSLVRFYNSDYNGDGTPDSFRLTATFPMDNSEEVYGVTALFAFDYRIYQRSSAATEAIAYVEYRGARPGIEYRIVGEMKAVQKSPLKPKAVGGSSGGDDAHVVLANFEKHGFDYEELADLLSPSHSSAVNLSATFVPAFSKWFEKPTNAAADFTINLKINYPEDTFTHYSHFFELLKWGWIQFYALFVILFYLCSRCQRFIFENHLVAAEEDSDSTIEAK